MTQPQNIPVEIAFATPQKQLIKTLNVVAGTTAKQAVIQSNIAEVFPEINIETNAMGIFGNTLGSKGLVGADEYILKAGDRVEIYRPLIADPKEARRKRAEKAK